MKAFEFHSFDFPSSCHRIVVQDHEMWDCCSEEQRWIIEMTFAWIIESRVQHLSSRDTHQISIYIKFEYSSLTRAQFILNASERLWNLKVKWCSLDRNIPLLSSVESCFLSRVLYFENECKCNIVILRFEDSSIEVEKLHCFARGSSFTVFQRADPSGHARRSPSQG